MDYITTPYQVSFQKAVSTVFQRDAGFLGAGRGDGWTAISSDSRFHFSGTLNFSFFPITTKCLMDVPSCQVAFTRSAVPPVDIISMPTNIPFNTSGQNWSASLRSPLKISIQVLLSLLQVNIFCVSINPPVSPLN